MKVLSILAIVAVVTMPAITNAQAQNSILEDEYVVSQEFVEAEVLRVSVRERTMTVKGANRGETRQFAVPENVRVTVNGRPANLRDIRRGDNVSLSIVRREQRVVVAQVMVPQTSNTLENRRANPVMVAEATPSMLPKTAGNQPMILLFGLFALLAAAALRAARL